MAGINTALHFAVRIKGTESNLTVNDNSAGSDVSLTIPAGVYFYKHADPTKDLFYVVNQIIATYGSFSRSNDRQLTLSLTDSSDYLEIPDTDDRQVICEALGLYTNAGLFTDTWSDGDVTQITASSCFVDGGYIYEQHDFDGFPEFSAEHFPAEGGTTAAITGSRKNYFDLTLSTVPGTLVNGAWNLGTQSVYKTTLNTDESVTFWRAYDPENREPQVYLNSATYGARTYYLRAPVGYGDISPINSENNLFYDIALALTLNEDAGEQIRYLYNDGSDLPATAADSSEFDTQSFTLGLEVIGSDGAALQVLAAKVLAPYGASNYEWSVIKNTSEQLVFTVVYGTTSTSSITSTETLDAGEKYRCAVWFDRSNEQIGYEIYHVESGDREEDTSPFPAATDRKASLDADIHLLATNNGAAYYEATGYISNVFYMDSVLSSLERLEYEETGTPPKALHYWPLDEQSGDVGVDYGSATAITMDTSALSWKDPTA